MHVFIFWIAYLSSSYMYFLKIPISPPFFRSGMWYIRFAIPVCLTLTNPTPTLVCLWELSSVTSTSPSHFFFYLRYPVIHIYPFKITLNPLTGVQHTFVQHLREYSKSVQTKRGTIFEGSAARMKNGNLYRETGSVYFYLINVNLLSHKIARNVDLVKLHTGHNFWLKHSTLFRNEV